MTGKDLEAPLDRRLDPEEVSKRLREYGYNEIAEKRASPVKAFLRKFWGITPWMLEVTIALE